MIGSVIPSAKSRTDRIVAQLGAGTARLALRPIYADFKLEHVFIGDGRITLIDTECLSLGPPDYDLAQFYGRLHMAAQARTLPEATVRAACEVVKQIGGGSFDWCLGVVALRLAKFHAQRPGPFSAAQLIPPDSPASLGAALRTLITSPHLRLQLGCAARQRSAAFDWTTTAGAVTRVYDSLLTCPGPFTLSGTERRRPMARAMPAVSTPP